MRVLSQSEIDSLLSNLLKNPSVLPDNNSADNKDKQNDNKNDKNINTDT